jgi:DNA invertase Pin-like site-specific DNA recombinase
MFTRAYLRASTSEQDATRAKGALDAFAKEHGIRIASYYVENESGASLQRPELFRLLDDCQPGDVLLIEQVDRLSRLTSDDWARLKADITARQIRVVSLDLPTSWMMLSPAATDTFTADMFKAINGMLLDMLAAISRKDYEDRRRRQAEGIAKNKAKFKGRPVDAKLHANIADLLAKGVSWNVVQRTVECSRATIAAVAKARKAEAA